MKVYVHIWDNDNASVYGSHQAALDGLADSFGDEGSIEDCIYAAENAPGEPFPIPGAGFEDSTLRYLTVEGNAEGTKP